MTDFEWEKFESFRSEFQNLCKTWNKSAGDFNFPEIQKKLAQKDGVPDYPIENPLVYNTKLDSVTKDSEIKLILVSDNPGKDEQLEKNKAYLVGQAGKLGKGFFEKNPSLGIDFDKNVLILNKSPVHTAKTKELGNLVSLLDEAKREDGKKLLNESQRWMGRNIADLQKIFSCPLWIVGYSELKKKGIFEIFLQELLDKTNEDDRKNYFLFQHFSMNRFTIDLKQNWNEALDVKENLENRGAEHRNRIFKNFLE